MRLRITLGVVLAAIGLTWALGLSGITIFPGGWSAWWPSVLILLGALNLLLPRRRPVAGIALIAIGTLLQTWRLEIVPGVPWAYAAPIALLALGIGILVSALTWRLRRRAYACEEHAEWHEA